MDGNRPIPSPWCSEASRPNIYILYVGSPPHFDACMERICISNKPLSHRIAYLSAFHWDKLEDGFNWGTFTTYYVDTRGGYNATSFAGTPEQLDAGIDLLVTSEFYGYFDVDGWILGDGGYFDPCLDRQAAVKTGAVFGAFGASLLLIVLVRSYEAWRERKGGWSRSGLMTGCT